MDFKRVDLLSPELLRSDLGFNEDGKNHHKGRTPNRVGRPNLTVAVTANSQLFGEKKHPVHSAAAQVRTTLGPRRGGHAPTGRKEERKTSKTPTKLRFPGARFMGNPFLPKIKVKKGHLTSKPKSPGQFLFF